MDGVVVRDLDAAVNGTGIRLERFGVEDMVDAVEKFVAVVAESWPIAASGVGIGQCLR